MNSSKLSGIPIIEYQVTKFQRNNTIGDCLFDDLVGVRVYIVTVMLIWFSVSVLDTLIALNTKTTNQFIDDDQKFRFH